MNMYQMNDLKLAKELASIGHTQEAYKTLKALTEKDDIFDIEPFLWLAFTAPSLKEAEEAINTASVMAPDDARLNSAKIWLKVKKGEISPRQEVIFEYEGRRRSGRIATISAESAEIVYKAESGNWETVRVQLGQIKLGGTAKF